LDHRHAMNVSTPKPAAEVVGTSSRTRAGEHEPPTSDSG
jgi:hypothetical protein